MGIRYLFAHDMTQYSICQQWGRGSTFRETFGYPVVTPVFEFGPRARGDTVLRRDGRPRKGLTRCALKSQCVSRLVTVVDLEVL